MKLVDLNCPKCGREQKDVLLGRDERPPGCQKCKGVEMRISPPAIGFTVGPGRSQESRQDWAAKRRKQLEKRSRDWDKSPAGQETRAKSLARVFK